MMEFNDKSIMRKETFIETYDTVKNDLKENNHDFNYQDYLKKGEEYFESYKIKNLENFTYIDENRADKGETSKKIYKK